MKNTMKKVLEIGNYPPPLCGWAMETKLVVDELRRSGCTCDVLKINENRKVRSSEYVDVQSGFDYFRKVIRFARGGYQFHIHVNGESKKGYFLALLAAIVGRLACTPALLTFHGGLPQTYFPKLRFSPIGLAFKILFHLAGGVRCDSEAIKRAIEGYGIKARRVTAIAAFSAQYLNFAPRQLQPEIDAFLAGRQFVFFCYVSFRPEYRLDTLREAMSQFRKSYPRAGFVWLGFPDKEVPAVEKFARDWAPEEREALLLLGNLGHDEFLTLMQRCFACIRTPACDGVSASVLEALALGVPIVASENGRRPGGVVTYRQDDPVDLCAKLVSLATHQEDLKRVPIPVKGQDNVRLIADWVMAGISGQNGSLSLPGGA